jgi:hypothetical protein
LFGVGLTSKTKVGDLHSVDRRGRRRSDKVRVTAESGIIGGGRRYENVFGLNIAVEEVVGVDVVQTGQDLVKNTLDVLAFKVFVVTGLHQLI